MFVLIYMTHFIYQVQYYNGKTTWASQYKLRGIKDPPNAQNILILNPPSYHSSVQISELSSSEYINDLSFGHGAGYSLIIASSYTFLTWKF